MVLQETIWASSAMFMRREEIRQLSLCKTGWKGGRLTLIEDFWYIDLNKHRESSMEFGQILSSREKGFAGLGVSWRLDMMGHIWNTGSLTSRAACIMQAFSRLSTRLS
jgi:hypothetical protein